MAAMIRKVLWVEDEPSLRLNMEPLLESIGYSLAQANDDASAIELYNENIDSLGMIIADVNLSGEKLLGLAEFNSNSAMFPFIVFLARQEASLAERLIEYGVRDFLVKPVTQERFMAVVKNSLERGPRAACAMDREGLRKNRSEMLVIPSKTEELSRALEWLRNRTEYIFGQVETDKYLCFVNEILLNAHEHGNLRISEDEKMSLLERDIFQREVESREKEVDARIEISLTIDGEKVIVKITDEGGGFDFKKYINMSKKDLTDRLFSPCGRGIYITSHYFDEVEYCKGGSCVTLTKAKATADFGGQTL